VRESRDHETWTSCYVGKDRTVLEVSYWIVEPIEFSLFYAPDEGDLRCADSPLVSQELATASGLKLGLTKKEVIRIMGSPSKKAAQHFVYEITTERPPTPEEINEFRTKGGPPWDVKTIQIYQKVEIVFRTSKVISIAVTRTVTL